MNENIGLAEVMTKAMTIQQVATVLNVSDQTIMNWTNKLYPGITQKGKATYLTEEQVTRIKQSIGTGRNDLQNILEVKNATTQLEIAQKTLEVILYWKSQAEALDATVTKMLPAHDFGKSLLDAVDTYFPMNEASKILEPLTGMGRNILFAWLRDKKILRENNTPYQKYIDDGYFRVTEKGTAVGPKAVTMVSNRGIDYIRKLFKKDNED
jgi:phage antirepressor YoqD-like protein